MTVCKSHHTRCQDRDRQYCLCINSDQHPGGHQCACGCRWTDKETDQ